jgi:hypothetical protein
MTGRDPCRFTVKEYGDGTPFIAMERCGGDLALLQFGNLYLDLREGTTYEKGEEIASRLNDNIQSLAYTIRLVDEDIPVDGGE